MRTMLWTSLLIGAVLVASCASAETPTPAPALLIGTPESVNVTRVSASAEVVPELFSQLSFVLSGQVKTIDVEEGEVVQKGQKLMSLDTTELEFAVVAAEAVVRGKKLEAEIQRFRRKDFTSEGIKYSSGPRELIEVADARLAQAQAALESTKAMLAEGTLVAPYDGTVVAIDVKPSEYVSPGQVVLLLADLSNLQIETTDLSERNVTLVKTGQPATVFVEALGQEFPGTISAISPISGTIGGDVVFQVTIDLAQQPHDLLWGMSADVDINVE